MIKYLAITILFVSTSAQIDSKGYCAPYHGKVCIKYINNGQMVWFPEKGGWLNEEITDGLWRELVVGLKEPCRGAAEVCLHND